MLQNREVGGATMGADGGSAVRQVTFGPWGYLVLAVATVVLASLLGGTAIGADDPFGLRWSWLGLAAVVVFTGLTAAIRKPATDTERRYREGRRDLAYRVQRAAPFVVVGLFAAGFLAVMVGATVLAIALGAGACGVTAGLAPTYFVRRP